jgi:type IV secretion system protein VirD4
MIFLGRKERTTLKELSETLGKETIDTFNTGESRGREISHSLNYLNPGFDRRSVKTVKTTPETRLYQ